MSQDRRITKTKKAIYAAFLELMAEVGYDKLTVRDLIDRADIGRSTFYNHYDSKEALLDQLCQELFHHIFRTNAGISLPDYLEHLIAHFLDNRDRISSLLLAQNPYFMARLKEEWLHDVAPRLAADQRPLPAGLKQHFYFMTFVDTLVWALGQRQSYSAGELVGYYLDLVGLV